MYKSNASVRSKENQLTYLGLPGKYEIPNDYEQYVWISSGCTDGVDWCKNNAKQYSVIKGDFEKNTSDNTEYLKKAKILIRELLVDSFNKMNNSDYQAEEWEFLVGQWFDCYLLILQDAYNRAQQLKKVEGRLECDIYNDEVLPPLDFAEFLELITDSSEYRAYVYLKVLNEVRTSELLCRRKKKCHIERTNDSIKKRSWKTALYRRMLYASKSVFKIKDKIVFNNCYFPKDLTMRFWLSSKGRATDYINNWYMLDRPLLNRDVDRQKRELISNIKYDGDDEFVALAVKFLADFLPMTFVENFQHMRKKALTDYRYALNAKTVFYSCMEGHIDEIFKVYLMEMKRQWKSNVTLCDVQHGGNYGIDNSWKIDDEFNNCDVFYTWGWDAPQNVSYAKKIKRMPAAKLTDKKLSRMKTASGILYVNYLFPKYPVDPLYKADLNYVSVENELRFFRELSGKVKEVMSVRLYPKDYGWNFKKRLNEISTIQYDNNGDFYESLNQCELVVLSDWSTTVLEALVSGKPILVLRNSETKEYALDDINALIKVGVVVESWEDLKKTLETIYEDVLSWWNEPHRKEVVDKITQKYAFLPENASQLWVKEIKSYISRI